MPFKSLMLCFITKNKSKLRLVLKNANVCWLLNLRNKRHSRRRRLDNSLRKIAPTTNKFLSIASYSTKKRSTRSLLSRPRLQEKRSKEMNNSDAKSTKRERKSVRVKLRRQLCWNASRKRWKRTARFKRQRSLSKKLTSWKWLKRTRKIKSWLS